MSKMEKIAAVIVVKHRKKFKSGNEVVYFTIQTMQYQDEPEGGCSMDSEEEDGDYETQEEAMEVANKMNKDFIEKGYESFVKVLSKQEAYKFSIGGFLVGAGG